MRYHANGTKPHRSIHETKGRKAKSETTKATKNPTDNLQCKANTEKEGLRLDAIRDITKLLVKDKSPTGLAMRRTMMLLKPEGSQVTLPTGVYRIGLQELVDAKLVVVNPYETEKLVAFSLTPLGREVAKLLEWEMARR